MTQFFVFKKIDSKVASHSEDIFRLHLKEKVDFSAFQCLSAQQEEKGCIKLFVMRSNQRSVRPTVCNCNLLVLNI